MRNDCGIALALLAAAVSEVPVARADGNPGAPVPPLRVPPCPGTAAAAGSRTGALFDVFMKAKTASVLARRNASSFMIPADDPGAGATITTGGGRNREESAPRRGAIGTTMVPGCCAPRGSAERTIPARGG